MITPQTRVCMYCTLVFVTFKSDKRNTLYNSLIISKEFLHVTSSLLAGRQRTTHVHTISQSRTYAHWCIHMMHEVFD